MAQPWIKMRTDVADDAEVLRLKQLCKLPDKFAVVGRLHAFWSWWDEKARNGRVDGAVTVDVDEIVHTPGFGDAMVSVKWLAEDANGLWMPNFDRHNGRAAKERALGNQRQEAFRSRNGGSNGKKTPKSRHGDGDRVIRSRGVVVNKQSHGIKTTAAPEKPRTATPVEKPSTPTGEAPPQVVDARPPQDPEDRAPIAQEVRDAIRKGTAGIPRKAARIPKGNGSVAHEHLPEPEWWETPAGIQREADNRGVERIDGQEFPEFKARVFAAAGQGPWVEQSPPQLRERIEHWRIHGVNPA